MDESLRLCPCQRKADGEHLYTDSGYENLAARVGKHGFLVLGYHWIYDRAWHCLENVQTGEHFDVRYQAFCEALDDERDERISRLNEMEVLAWASK